MPDRSDQSSPSAERSRSTEPVGRNVQGALRGVVRQAGFESDWYLVVLAAITGVVTAGAAVVFAEVLHTAAEWLAHLGDEHADIWWLVLGLPVLGAAATGILVHFGARDAQGHGVPQIMATLYRGRGQVSARVVGVKAAASICTIGSGGSAGAEGPIVQIGSGIGSNIARWLHVSPDQVSTLLGCGAAAGIASVFNAPIAGIFFVLEILLRDFSIRTFTPIVIASVFSAGMTQAIKSDQGTLFDVTAPPAAHARVEADAIPGVEPHVPLVEASPVIEPERAPERFSGEFSIFEIPYYLGLGVLCGLVAVLFIRALDWTEERYDRFRIHPILKPITGALLLWAMSVVVAWQVRDHPLLFPIPPYYGNGYPFILQALKPDIYLHHETWSLLKVMLGLLVLKMIATSMTLGSGGSGGVFAPSLFLGAATGAAFGVVVAAINPLGFVTVSPASYALVGMAAVVAGTTHGPLTAILMLFEITGHYRVILPIMVAAVIATVVAQRLLPDSIYTIKLRKQGIRIDRLSDHTLLRRIHVRAVPLAKPILVEPDEPARRLLELAEQHNAVDFVVVDDRRRYLGMIVAEDLRTTLLQIEALPLLVVGELMRPGIPTTHPDESLDEVMDKFSRHDGDGLAVLDPDADDRVVGVITRSHLMRQYHLALEQSA